LYHFFCPKVPHPIDQPINTSGKTLDSTLRYQLLVLLLGVFLWAKDVSIGLRDNHRVPLQIVVKPLLGK
jgi:hypothetical protein